MRSGSCRCGRLRYELRGQLGFTFNCHCSFCRRIHGSAFTTVSIVPRESFRWSESSGEPAVFVTPLGSVRHFCGICASPMCNRPREPELLCLVVASLDDQRDAAPWAHLNTESKASWFEIADALPQFTSFPSPDEIAELMRRNRRGASR
ncbi:MAG: GFA family protein [Myxococcota bacterium]